MKNPRLKIGLLLLPLVFAVWPAGAQTEILNETLVNKFLDTAKPVDESPAGYEYWNFVNCQPYKDGSDYFLQIGRSTYKGSITTPQLKNLSGNARITFDLYALYSNEDICFSLVNGETEEIVKHYSPTTRLQWLPQALLLKDLSEDTRIKFSCNSDNFKFYVRNIVVTDVGDVVYYESFDALNGVGGNDNNFGLVYNANYKNKLSTSYFDYPNSQYESFDNTYGLYAAKQCLFFWTGSYTTAPIPLESTNDCILSFRVAGTGNSSGDLKFTVNGTNMVSSVKLGEWSTIEIPLNSLAPNSQISFTGSQIVIDDVKVTERNVFIDETADNATSIVNGYNHLVNVSLHRTLKAGIWNTLCLPFEFTSTSIPGVGIELRRVSSITTDGVYNFTPDTSIPAGEPFLVRVSSTVENPTFSGVKIAASQPKTILGGNQLYGFQGTFSPIALKTNGTHLFLGTDGNLYQPEEGGNTLNGMRAYFILPGGMARIAHVDDEAAGIANAVQPSATVERIYNLKGQSVSSPRRGLYILRSADGKNVKKIMIK